MRSLAIWVLLILVSSSFPSMASDACSPLSIKTKASVLVSDGSTFDTETLFHSVEGVSFLQRRRDSETLIAVEGPLSWVRQNDETSSGNSFHKLFALGHQFHAFLLYFEDLTGGANDTAHLEFAGSLRNAVSGDYPYGGRVHLVQSEQPERPLGLVFDFPETSRISVTFSDWRQVNDQQVPFELVIDDGQRQFTYSYTDVTISERSPLWFMDALGSVALDRVNVYRLHRRLLAAHCLGDADMMASLSAGEVLSANRGVLAMHENASLQKRFSGLFSTLNYTEYRDLKPPVIEVSDSGDIAWIAVEVQARGHAIEAQTPFDDQWAWFMLAKKIDGVWKHLGNASNAAP